MFAPIGFFSVAVYNVHNGQVSPLKFALLFPHVCCQNCVVYNILLLVDIASLVCVCACAGYHVLGSRFIMNILFKSGCKC